MLTFIILGYVPGTNFQITFNSFMLVVTLATSLVALIWYFNSYKIKKQAKNIMAIQLISL